RGLGVGHAGTLLLQPVADRRVGEELEKLVDLRRWWLGGRRRRPFSGGQRRARTQQQGSREDAPPGIAPEAGYHGEHGFSSPGRDSVGFATTSRAAKAGTVTCRQSLDQSIPRAIRAGRREALEVTY